MVCVSVGASRLVQEEYIAVFYATHEKDTAVG